MTYDGLESCIVNSQLYRNGSTISGDEVFPADSFNEEDTSCSSSKNAFGSFFSDCTKKGNQEEIDEWSDPESPEHFYAREKPAYTAEFSDVEAMKEKFAKLLLGEDVTGGCKGITKERRDKWRKEMDWLLSPANYMIELVPAKQSGTNGRTFEIMTPKARADVHMNLPALQKIDSMLIVEFWYAEGNSRKDGNGGSARQSKRWWLPFPRVPAGGLTETARKKLLSQGNMVHQVFKAAKSINENSGRACLGEDLYKVISSGSSSALDIVDCLKLRSEHEVLDTFNKLETAALTWREKIKEQISGVKTPVRTSWPFMKEPIPEVDKMKSLLFRVDALLYQLKMRYPCLPHTFLNATKIQFGKDGWTGWSCGSVVVAVIHVGCGLVWVVELWPVGVDWSGWWNCGRWDIGHLMLEAYSRVLGNLAYSILSRIGDILQEDHTSNPNSPMPTSYFSSGSSIQDSPIFNPRIRHSLVDQMNKVDEYFSDSNPSRCSDSEISSSTDAKSSSVTATPSSSRIWCIGKDACINVSPNCSFS
ncbi:Rop guanine nucleotide exchange factor 14 [Bienertia sinuspersici]